MTTSATSTFNVRPHLALLLCNIIWACDYPFYSMVLGHYVKPVAMVSASLIVTALLSLVPLLWQKPEKIDRKDIKIMFAAALVIGVARKLLLMYGMSLTSPIDGSIIETVVPLLVLILSVMIGIDRFTRLKIAGLALGMIGAVAIVLTGASGSHEHSGFGGNMMILCCAFATALYMVWFKKLIAKYRITTVLRWVYCFAALIMLPFGGYEIVHTDYAAMDTRIVLAALFVLIVPTYLPNLMLNYSLRYVQPTVSSIYTYIQPLLAVVLSIAMGLDKLHADTVIAAMLIFVGVGCVIGSYAAGSSVHGRPHLR